MRGTGVCGVTAEAASVFLWREEATEGTFVTISGG